MNSKPLKLILLSRKATCGASMLNTIQLFLESVENKRWICGNLATSGYAYGVVPLARWNGMSSAISARRRHGMAWRMLRWPATGNGEPCHLWPHAQCPLADNPQREPAVDAGPAESAAPASRALSHPNSDPILSHDRNSSTL